MKVLLLTRPRDGFIGGDFRQVNRIEEALRLKGVDVVVSDNVELNISTFDVIHLFVLVMPLNLKRINRLNSKKIIISPIYRDPKYDE